MSQAWMNPVVVWSERKRASVVRIGGRAAITLGWALVAARTPWPWLQGAVMVLAAVAALHTVLAIANSVRSKGVVLRLMGSGTIEWQQSLQEKWLKRPIDWVDGAEIDVVVLPKFPGYALTDPRVNLRGATHSLENLPLFGARPEDFIAAVNAAAAGRGVMLVAAGTSQAAQTRKAARRGTRRAPARASDD